MEYKDVLKEILRVHQEVSHLHPQHQIPSSHLPHGMGYYLGAIAKAREEARTQKEINTYMIAELFFKDFVDPTGEYETTKAFNTIDKKMQENLLFSGWVEV
jgi:hypothetical protein